MSATEELAEDLAEAEKPTVSFDTGVVEALVDASHSTVDLGDKSVPVFVPESMYGAAGVGAFVRVSLQEDTYTLDSVLAGGSASLVPVGVVVPFAGSTAPSGWAFCNGAAVSRTTYATLFATIGTTFGSGDGSTTFNLPGMHGKAPYGRDPTQTEFDGLGETGGSKDSNALMAHTHDMGNHTHTVSNIGIGTVQEGTGGTANVYYPSGANSATSGPSTNTTGSAGSGSTFSILPPYIVLNYIIRMV